jgi:hypothetical protein
MIETHFVRIECREIFSTPVHVHITRHCGFFWKGLRHDCAITGDKNPLWSEKVQSYFTSQPASPQSRPVGPVENAKRNRSITFAKYIELVQSSSQSNSPPSTEQPGQHKAQHKTHKAFDARTRIQFFPI